MSVRKPSKRCAVLLRVFAIFFSVAPPALAVLLYFPLWESASAEKLLSGGAVLLLILCAIPIFKFIKARLKSPAAYMLWLLTFLLFYLTSSIAEQMCVISFTGLLGNIIGALLFRLARGIADEK